MGITDVITDLSWVPPQEDRDFSWPLFSGVELPMAGDGVAADVTEMGLLGTNL